MTKNIKINKQAFGNSIRAFGGILSGIVKRGVKTNAHNVKGAGKNLANNAKGVGHNLSAAIERKKIKHVYYGSLSLHPVHGYRSRYNKKR